MHNLRTTAQYALVVLWLAIVGTAVVLALAEMVGWFL